jgi:hypothetical protein
VTGDSFTNSENDERVACHRIYDEKTAPKIEHKPNFMSAPRRGAGNRPIDPDRGQDECKRQRWRLARD